MQRDLCQFPLAFFDSPPALGDGVARFDAFDLFAELLDLLMAACCVLAGGGGEFEALAIESGFGKFDGAAEIAGKDGGFGAQVLEEDADVGNGEFGDGGGGGAAEVADEVCDGGVGFVSDAGGDGDCGGDDGVCEAFIVEGPEVFE